MPGRLHFCCWHACHFPRLPFQELGAGRLFPLLPFREFVGMAAILPLLPYPGLGVGLAGVLTPGCGVLGAGLRGCWRRFAVFLAQACGLACTGLRGSALIFPSKGVYPGLQCAHRSICWHPWAQFRPLVRPPVHLPAPMGSIPASSAPTGPPAGTHGLVSLL
jgi:hypothetical protein